MKLDSAGLQILSREECLELLGRARIGRIVFTERALPAVMPVNFALAGDTVVIRTEPGSQLAIAARDTVVAFEVDEFRPETGTAWSVTAVGHACAVGDPAEIGRLSRLPLTPWAPGGRDHYIVLRAEWLSGRRLLVGRRPGDAQGAQGNGTLQRSVQPDG
jgi:hypothetical protein